MRYYSIFSGIEAASVSWGPLGWEPLLFSEIEEFPSAVLKARFPSVPNLGDITKINWKEAARDFGRPDIVVGGSPCQSFSIAGGRTGLEGASGLMREYVRCVREVKPDWLLWENVPGALSSSHGEDFRCLLEALDACGYGLAWRVLDAQFFNLAQRRERVFLVGRLGDVEGPCEVLFEPESLSWDTQSSREKRAALAENAGCRAQGPGCVQIAGNVIGRGDGNGGHQLGVADPDEGGAFTLTTADRHAVAFAQNTRDEVRLVNGDGSIAGALAAQPGAKQQTYLAFKFSAGAKAGSAAVNEDGYAVRRLTPRECERLQGFPDDWTKVPYRGKTEDECPDTPRYKAIGNSMAVPVMRWIGERIQEVDE